MYAVHQGEIYIHPQRARLIVKKGIDNIALPLEDIVLLYTRDKIVYAIDRFSGKYTSDKTLSELGEELDNKIFFRANRQYIVSINYIRSFKSYEKVKLLLGLIIPGISHSIVVSQETAPLFRKWLRNA